MGFFDFLFRPQRVICEMQLKSDTDALRNKIDNYKQTIEQCKYEIQTLKEHTKSEFNQTREQLTLELNDISHTISELQPLLPMYTDACIQYQLLYLSKQKTLTVLKLTEAFRKFTSQNIKLIKDDIKILEERKVLLSKQVGISDFLALQQLNGVQLLPNNDQADVDKLIKAVKDAKDDPQVSKLTKTTLGRLNTLLQERSEFLDVIDQISWLIKQKKQSISELYNCQKKQPTDELNEQLNALQLKLDEQYIIKFDLANEIRLCWEIPLDHFQSELEENFTTLNDLFKESKSIAKQLSDNKSQMRAVKSNIQQMKDAHSDDSDRWNALQNQRISLSQEWTALSDKFVECQKNIDDVKKHITSIKNRKKNIEQVKETVRTIYNQYQFYIPNPNNLNHQKLYLEAKIKRNERELENQKPEATKSLQNLDQRYSLEQSCKAQIEMVERQFTENYERLGQAEQLIQDGSNAANAKAEALKAVQATQAKHAILNSQRSEIDNQTNQKLEQHYNELGGQFINLKREIRELQEQLAEVNQQLSKQKSSNAQGSHKKSNS